MAHPAPPDRRVAGANDTDGQTARGRSRSRLSTLSPDSNLGASVAGAGPPGTGYLHPAQATPAQHAFHQNVAREAVNCRKPPAKRPGD